jgi:hypothetical protein
MMDGDDEVDCEPGARHDDCPSVIVVWIGLSPDFAFIEFGDITAGLDCSRYRQSPLWFWGQRQRIGMDLGRGHLARFIPLLRARPSDRKVDVGQQMAAELFY